MSVVSWYKTPQQTTLITLQFQLLRQSLWDSPTQEQETWVTLLAEALVPGSCNRIHYSAAVDTTPVVGRWTWIQPQLFGHYNVRFRYLTECKSGTTKILPI